MQAIISETIRQGIAAGLQQSRRASVGSGFHFAPKNDLNPQIQGDFLSFPEQYSPGPSHRSQSQISEEEEGQRELQLSDDEDMGPDQPAFTGLFQHSLFQSLLFKARNSARLGSTSTQAESSNSLI